MASKAQFVGQVRTAATQLKAVCDQLIDWRQVYFDRGYGSGGADELTDQDLAGIGVTAAQIAGVINLAAQLENLLTGQSVTADAWNAVISAVRTDV